MRQTRSISFLIALMLLSLACSLSGGGGDSAAGTDENLPATEGAPAVDSGVSSEFPLPKEYSNLIDLGGGSVNFQTSMKMADVISFYRDAFAKAGYQERELNTSITDTGFSIVWDGHASGKALVVQGVDMGNGTVNVNIRLEDN